MKKISKSVKETINIGKKLAKSLKGGEIILLSGALGAGKTVLAKGIASGLGISQNDVISPTFVLLRIHKGKHSLQHFDFYRIKNQQDIFALGYEEYFYSDGVTLVEWPERLKFLKPREFLRIKLSSKDKNTRTIEFSAKGKKHKDLLKKIK